MKNKVLLTVLVLLLVKVQAQNILSSNSFIQTCINNSQCFSINNSSYLFYDESKNALYLKIDFVKFKSGQDSLDEWLDDLSSTFLYFKAPVDKEVFQSGFANHHTKVLKLHGQAYLNGIWRNQDVELSLFSSENSVINTSNNNQQYDNIKVNFGLTILPKDYKIHKKAHHLKKSIFIGITMGRINLLQAGMESILKEAYDHQ